jgi:hypothetical protein
MSSSQWAWDNPTASVISEFNLVSTELIHRAAWRLQSVSCCCCCAAAPHASWPQCSQDAKPPPQEHPQGHIIQPSCCHTWSPTSHSINPNDDDAHDDDPPQVCSESWKSQLANSFFFLGYLIGSGVFGSLADSHGRKPSLFGATAIGERHVPGCTMAPCQVSMGPAACVSMDGWAFRPSAAPSSQCRSSSSAVASTHP